MESICVNPGEGKLLRDEKGRKIVTSDKGTRIANSTYMRRRLACGDAVLVLEEDS